MVINHNMSAMFSQRQLGVTNTSTQKNMEKLSSGMKINRAGDDASGLAVSEKMRSQIRGLNQASTNAQNGISFIQTTEGYLQETTDIIQRIRELAVQASNGIYTDEDRMQIQVEVSQLVAEVDRIASAAQFNGMNMLTGRFARPEGTNSVTGSMWLHIGANMDQRMQVYIGTMTATALNLRNIGDETIMSLESPDSANRAIGTLDEALKGMDESEQHYIEFPEQRLKFYRMLTEGQYWKDLPEEAQKEEPVVRMDTAKPQAGKVIQDYAQREYHEEDFAVDAVMQMWMEDKQNDAQ